MTQTSHTSTGTRTGHTRMGTRTRTRTHVVGRGSWVEFGLWSIHAVRRGRYKVSRAWHWIESAMSPAGWLMFAWALGGISTGLLWGWSEFLVGGLLALALLIIGVPFLLGRESYAVDFSLKHDAVVAGTQAHAEIVVRNPASRVALPGRIDIPVGSGLIDFQVPLLRKGHEHREGIVIPTPHRGIIDVGPATTVRADPLRLLRREFFWAEVHTLHVHPKTISIPSTSIGFIRDLEGSPTGKITNEDISFHAIREYARGDAQRHVHWKSTAKTGVLMVRQFDETRRSTISLILDVHPDSYASPVEFEMAVSAVGSLGIRAIRDGRDVQVVVSGEVPEFARASVRSIDPLRVTSPRALLDDLSGVESHADVMDLGTVTHMLAESQSETSLAFLVTGSLTTLNQIQSASLAFPVDVGVAAVLCNPEAEPAMRVFGELRVLSLGVLDDLRQLMARGAAS